MYMGSPPPVSPDGATTPRINVPRVRRAWAMLRTG